MHSSVSRVPLTPEQRLAEVAAILASGILRLHQRGPRDFVTGMPEPTFPIRAESVAQGLEIPAETVLSVLHGG